MQSNPRPERARCFQLRDQHRLPRPSSLRLEYSSQGRITSLKPSEGEPVLLASLDRFRGWMNTDGCTVPFALERNHHPGGSGFVDLLVDLGVETDGAHDTISELLIQDGLVGIAIVLHNLVEPVD